MTESTRETLIEARLRKVEDIVDKVAENQLRSERKLDRLSDEIAETNKILRKTISAVDQTNTAVNMFVSAMIAQGEGTDG